MAYLMGVDLGTSGTKTALFDEQGRCVASCTVGYPLSQPKNGWAEQRPEDWWEAAKETIVAVLAKSGVTADEIKGVGLSGQMHGLVMLDAEGKVLRPAILWCDGRTGAECEEITQRVGKERLIQITANPALPGFTASKILWVRKHEPEIYEKCRHILLPKDYLRYRLTGEFVTEVSDASGMNLLDISNRRWSQEVLDSLEIDPALLGEVHESPDQTGTITAIAAWETGLKAGTPVAGGAGDNAAAAVGTGVVRTGRALLTLGTSGVIFAHGDRISIDPQGRVHTFCAAVPGGWTAMSCTLSAGLSLQWFRNQFCDQEQWEAKERGVDPYERMIVRAEQSPIGANRLIYLPYLMGERSPLLDEKARGAFLGLSAMHSRGDLIRAVMEGVSFSQRQCLDVLREMGMAPETIIACGGGARSPFWRQMLADVLGCTIQTSPLALEGPALGAAILAGVCAGVYSDVVSAADAIVCSSVLCEVDKAASAQYEPYYRLYDSLYPTLRDSFRTLADL
jgi:xylulokinase